MCDTNLNVYPQSEQDSHGYLQDRALIVKHHPLHQRINELTEQLELERARHGITQANLAKITDEAERMSQALQSIAAISSGNQAVQAILEDEVPF